MNSNMFQKKGFILFTVISALLVLLIIIIPLVRWTAHEFLWTDRSFKALRALNLADAGAESAIWEIVYNNQQFDGWLGANPKLKTFASFTDNYGETIGDIDVSAYNTSPDHYLITSTGYIPDKPNYDVKKTVKVKVFPHALFNNGIFGYNSVTLSGGALADSYDSSEGPYSPADAGSLADIGTNGSLTFEGDSFVKGDVFVGPTGSVTGNTPDHVTGETYYSGEEVDLGETPSVSEFIILPSQGNYTLGGSGSETVLSGDYRYESISVDGKSTLIFSSNTRVYVHNDFYIGGQAKIITNENVEFYIGGNGDFAGQGIVNASGTPSNLQIFGVGDNTSLSYTGQNDFYGTIFAPESSIYLAGNADFFGAVVGEDVTLAGNIQFHYDEELARTGPSVGYDIAYWQED